MSNDYWLRQTEEPLYPDIIWARPENKAGAGKLAIIGGNANAFSAPGIAYDEALAIGAGVVSVLLPDAIKKTVKLVLPDAHYAPSNPSGSFSKSALSDLMQLSSWSDSTFVAGDLGRNSETATMLESFAQQYSGLLTVTQDAVDYFKETPSLVVDRPQTLLVVSIAQLQRLFIATPSIIPIVYSMSSLALAEALHEYTNKHAATLMVLHNGLLFVAHDGTITTTANDAGPDDKIWRVRCATRASVFWLQSPNKPLEAITSSLVSDT